ncbi:aminotransferase class V-fold PLP-dependent enzyme [Singulisphaera acidiphila]|uniref:Selenocysteine lyase n=1 Tax=Singulisphaera acidiphila (strain ATCC BAA-1392 / DSM 18658 / VKM B-2454 / MOB10) TaxID=886293 RepID=L0DML2_SINAD|nr:aminotransferase class V-fold PLP-dependent enzyme [Singulisphaera acidiphila]AGA30492.1 selenocysteine lyase [Singulisphaera acidiphila DSM 18658]
MDWESLRAAEFPITERWAYFDHAAVAPIPRRAGDILRTWADDQEQNGVIHWLDWERKLGTTRRQIAELLNAEVDEIAFVSSTTHGIGLIAEGFPWREGDSVVTAAEEYPSNVYPWMNLASRGVELRTVPSRDGRVWARDLAAAIDETTRLLTISHVEFASGFRNDIDALAELCKARGIAFFVDAIQGLGPLVIDVKRTPIDFLAADGHKWLLGPEGAGLLFVRREWIDRLRPLGVGWHSVVSSFNTPGFNFTLKPSAERWEGGSCNMPGLQAFGASLSLIMELGKETVSQRILERAEAVREIARSAGWQVYGSTRGDDLSGIVALEREGVDPDVVVRRLRAAGVAVASRRGRLRISPHVYNNEEDLERLRMGLISDLGHASE